MVLFYLLPSPLALILTTAVVFFPKFQLNFTARCLLIMGSIPFVLLVDVQKDGKSNSAPSDASGFISSIDISTYESWLLLMVLTPLVLSVTGLTIRTWVGDYGRFKEHLNDPTLRTGLQETIIRMAVPLLLLGGFFSVTRVLETEHLFRYGCYFLASLMIADSFVYMICVTVIEGQHLLHIFTSWRKSIKKKQGDPEGADTISETVIENPNARQGVDLEHQENVNEHQENVAAQQDLKRRVDDLTQKHEDLDRRMEELVRKVETLNQSKQILLGSLLVHVGDAVKTTD